MFEVFVDAVIDAQREGLAPSGRPDQIAHVLTALVDGALFQVLGERVADGRSRDVQLRFISGLLDIVLAGFARIQG